MSINSMQDGDMVGDTDESLPLGRTYVSLPRLKEPIH
jgi:hypothetical protein